MIPDVEHVVTEYLNDENFRAVTETPGDKTTPWVKVQQFNARTVGSEDADYLQAFYLQIDCYAGTNGVAGVEEASDLKRDVRAALVGMASRTLDGAAVSAVRFTRDQRLPDDDMKPPRQRWQLDATVYAHSVHEAS